MNRHKVLLSAGLAGGMALAGCGASAAATVPVKLSATQVLAKALAAVKHETSVQVQGKGTVSGVTATESDDALAATGRQVISQGQDHAEILVVGKEAYLMANGPALDAYGFPKAAVASLAGKWISVPSNDPNYSSIAGGTIYSQTINQFHLGAPLSLLPATTVDGERVLGVRGLAPSSAGLPAHAYYDLYISASGPGLPVEAVYTSGKSRDVVSFSKWGEKLKLAAPSGALPIASIGG